MKITLKARVLYVDRDVFYVYDSEYDDSYIQTYQLNDVWEYKKMESFETFETKVTNKSILLENPIVLFKEIEFIGSYYKFYEMQILKKMESDPSFLKTLDFSNILSKYENIKFDNCGRAETVIFFEFTIDKNVNTFTEIELSDIQRDFENKFAAQKIKKKPKKIHGGVVFSQIRVRRGTVEEALEEGGCHSVLEKTGDTIYKYTVEDGLKKNPDFLKEPCFIFLESYAHSFEQYYSDDFNEDSMCPEVTKKMTKLMDRYSHTEKEAVFTVAYIEHWSHDYYGESDCWVGFSTIL